MAKVDFGVNYRRFVQTFWDPEPRNDDISAPAIWCLGTKYDSRNAAYSEISKSEELSDFYTSDLNIHPDDHQAEASPGSVAQQLNSQRKHETEKSWPAEFLDDCEARAWFTYRSSFPPIRKSVEASMTLSVRLRNLSDYGVLTSDTGWGCMIRSGQSILANALVGLRLGRNWRRGTQQHAEIKLLSLFADNPEAPFSIHRFVEHGASACGKYPGEWFGPSATAQCIQALSNEYKDTGLQVYVTGDGADAYADRFFETALSSGSFVPTLILVGVRLGIDRITPVYWDALKNFLRVPQAVGIAGGRPSSSHYFFAAQGDHLFYLDPHLTRSALPLHSSVDEYTKDEIDTCHTRRLRRLSLEDMDPSMLIAFIIRSEEDWIDWRRNVSEVAGTKVIHVADSAPVLHAHSMERSRAIDHVETFDDEEEETH